MIDRFFVTLRIQTHEELVDKLMLLYGSKAEKTTVKGWAVEDNKKSLFLLSSKLIGSDKPFDSHFRWLVDQIESHMPELLNASSFSEIRMSVFVSTRSIQPEFSINSSLVSLLGKLRGSIWIDIYTANKD